MKEKESNNLINFNARNRKCVAKCTRSLPSRNLVQSVKMKVNASIQMNLHLRRKRQNMPLPNKSSHLPELETLLVMGEM